MKNFMFTIGTGIILLTCGSQPGMAQISGKEIMQKVYNLPTGDDVQGELTMTLVNKREEQRVRKLKQYTLNQKDMEKKIMFFLEPADVKGTSFMNWSYTNGKEDDQWIFLPALNRTKRISSGSKSDYFMGSDFSYDDLGERHPDQDNHQLLREEKINGNVCYVVESTPKETDHVYSKTISWINKENLIGVKREFYDPAGDLLKVLSVSKYEKISGFWVILKTEMTNIQKTHKTLMEFSEVKINQGVSENQFTERSMMMGQ